MKIPKKIKILGHPIKVTCFGDTLEHPDGSECWGLAHKMTDQISLCTAFTEVNGDFVELSEMNIAETFLHEIIHHVEYKQGLELKEHQITALACGILQVIRDNKLDFMEGK